MMTKVVDLGPGRSGRGRVEHVFERERVQVVMEGESLDHVPGQAVDVHPTDFGKLGARLFEESGQAVVGEDRKLGALREEGGQSVCGQIGLSFLSRKTMQVACTREKMGRTNVGAIVDGLDDAFTPQVGDVDPPRIDPGRPGFPLGLSAERENVGCDEGSSHVLDLVVRVAGRICESGGNNARTARVDTRCQRLPSGSVAWVK